MLFFGTVTFGEDGRTYEWSSREEPPSTIEHPFEATAEGILVPTSNGPELVTWDAVEAIASRSLVAPAALDADRRFHEPSTWAEKHVDSEPVSVVTSLKSHHAFSHQPRIAHLDASGEERADDGAPMEDS